MPSNNNGESKQDDQHVGDRPEALPLLQEMYARWPFFNSLIENCEIALYQSDLDAASLYVHKLGNRESPSLFETIRREYERSLRCIPRVTRRPLLSGEANASAVRSLRAKVSYLDALNAMQVRLLREYRSASADGADGALLEAYEEAIVSSIEGIAVGLGVTG